MDVNYIPSLPSVDIVANAGGLYHVPSPEEILRKSYAMARRFLIVQTVIGLPEPLRVMFYGNLGYPCTDPRSVNRNKAVHLLSGIRPSASRGSVQMLNRQH